MLSYTSRRNLFGSLCNNSSAATLTVADSLMNASEKRLMSTRDWPFLWRQYTKTTVAAQQAYNLPAYTRTPQNVYVTVGSYRYQPEEVTNRSEWDALNEVVISSDIPTHYFIYDGQLLLFPTPASSSNTITFNGRRVARDLSIADTTGSATITTIATSGVTTTVTQSGSTWTSAMVGQYIRITPTNAVATSGDGVWYEIATVPSSATLTLTRTYGGIALSTGTASYTIGEMSLLPDPFAELPVYEGLKIYYTSVDPNPPQAKLYGDLSNELQTQMFRDYTSKANVVLDAGDSEPPVNPNYYVSY